MPIMKVFLDAPAWPDLNPSQVPLTSPPPNTTWLNRNDDPPIQIAAVEGGMQSGAPSVAIRIDLPDGRIVVAETSLRLFQMAAAALLGRFGDVT